MGSTDRWSGTERTLGACCSALSKRHPDCLVAKSFNDVKVSIMGVLAPGHTARWVLPSFFVGSASPTVCPVPLGWT